MPLNFPLDNSPAMLDLAAHVHNYHSKGKRPAVVADDLMTGRTTQRGELVVIVYPGPKFVYTPAQVLEAIKGRTAYRNVHGAFVSANQQDADQTPEYIRRRRAAAEATATPPSSEQPAPDAEPKSETAPKDKK